MRRLSSYASRLCLALLLLVAVQGALVHPLLHLGQVEPELAAQAAPSHALQSALPPAAHAQPYQHDELHQEDPGEPGHSGGCDTCVALHGLELLGAPAVPPQALQHLAGGVGTASPDLAHPAVRHAAFSPRAPPQG